MDGSQVATLTKGMKVEAQWFQANDPPSSLAGMQMKAGVTERNIVGTVMHIRGDDPVAPKEIRVALKPDEGGAEVWVKPEWIKRILVGETVIHVEADPKKQAKIANTTKEYRENPLRGLVEAMGDTSLGRRPGQFVRDMEARGQRELLSQTTQLPKKGSEDPAWAKMGVIFGKDVDELFRTVELPHGWKLEATEHSLWSELLDDKGRKRGAMFYKAAFYDRSAHIHATSRYQVDREYKAKGDYDGPRRAVVRDTASGSVVFAPTDFLPHSTTPEGYKADDEANKAVRQWLNENRPDWQNAAAYWGWD